MAEYIEKNEFFDAIRAEFYDRMPTGSEVISRLLKFPAADVRPVVRGKWEESVDQLQANCSVCKTSFPCWRMWPANFCPNCGAMMEGS